MALPTVHDESSVDGWGVGVSSRQSATYDSVLYHPPHLEASEDDFVASTTGTFSPSFVPVTTGPFYDSPPEITQPPTIVQGGLTLLPIPMTRTRTTSLNGALTTVSEAAGFQYVIDTITVALDAPITVKDVVIAMTTNEVGSTILIAGTMTTTIPGLDPSPRMAQTLAPINGFQVATTVDEGTTKYVLAGQTLAPGRPVTAGGVIISMATTDGSTILVVGDKITTVAGELPSGTSGEWGPSTVPPPGIVPNARVGPTTATTKAAAGRLDALGLPSQFLVAMSALLLSLM